MMNLLKKKLNSWPYLFVLCVWRDIIEDPKWMDGDEVTKTNSVEVFTAGWIRSIDKDEIKIAGTLILGKTRREDSSNITVIPRGCVTTIKVLRTNGEYRES